MARPREFDPNDVLQVAIALFWEKGYFDSSVDEVVRQSSVAKYGIYGVFGSKYRVMWLFPGSSMTSKTAAFYPYSINKRMIYIEFLAKLRLFDGVFTSMISSSRQIFFYTSNSAF